ncbi:hypothetical protein N5U04_05715 [Aliarcobacter butzleri]|uniref:hypothetical protein n=1 Tax=Aliarcobacter butzleri TaxID=28197 RepID=UPI0021B32871|nr:hypothetical protein [Aliarcobacter butzleri]MCT7550136.1 hypothetical protein [Aliarcobacter butzleri]MCT7559062.1 hypothetical protein [Aliarcobacter butzleri]
MKKIVLFILSLFLILNFSACLSKTQEEIQNTQSNDISKLLKTIIEKEKEINELNKKLEICESKKVIK